MNKLSWHSQPEQQHQFGGGGAPRESKTQKENTRLNNELLKRQLEQIGKQSEAPAMPPLPVAPPPPKYAPPPSATPADAEAASREAMRRTKMRRGFQKSKLGAGDTGARPAAAPTAVAQGAKPTLG